MLWTITNLLVVTVETRNRPMVKKKKGVILVNELMCVAKKRATAFHAMVLTSVTGACIGMAYTMAPALAAGGNAGAGIDSLFNVAGQIADSVKTGISGLVTTIAIAVAVYCLIRSFLASNPQEVSMYRKRFVAVLIGAFLAFMAPKLIEWVNGIANDITLTLSLIHI